MNDQTRDDDLPETGSLPSWLDPDEDGLRNLASEDSRRMGDHLWMGALLEEVHRPVGQTEREVEEHLSRWRRSNEVEPVSARTASGPAIPPGHEPSRRSWLISTLSVSAALASVFVLWSMSGGNTPTAQAAFEQAKQRAIEPIDRQYRIQFELPNIPAVEAELSLRGHDQLVLMVKGPFDSKHWIGTTREKSWFAPVVGPVLVAKDFQPVVEHVSRRLGLPPISLRIADVLKSIENDYSLDLEQDELIPAFGSTPARHVVAIKRKGFRPLLPMKISFWTHPDTGVVGRLILDWTGQLENVAVKQVTFELTEQEPLPDAWYEHASHHENLRPVLMIEPPTSKESAGPTNQPNH